MDQESGALQRELQAVVTSESHARRIEVSRDDSLMVWAGKTCPKI